MDKSTFSNYTLTATQAALQAGAILRKGFGSDFEITAKPGHQNFVTEYDHLSEALIIKTIQGVFPNDHFLAEESGLSTGFTQDENVLWIIDPLDGTTNFAHHLPLFAISIAAYQHGQIICGIIYQPMTDELFVAERGRGAYLNDKKIHVSQIDNLEHCLIAAGLPYVMDEALLLNVQKILHLSKTGTIFRNIGSAALSLAYVAAGKADAFWMCNIFPWDLAAGQILVEEAGGKVSQNHSFPVSLSVPSTVLASNETLHEILTNYLASSDKH
jgi:myo-inositol-1(or 4)-monophosphatase